MTYLYFCFCLLIVFGEYVCWLVQAFSTKIILIAVNLISFDAIDSLPPLLWTFQIKMSLCLFVIRENFRIQCELNHLRIRAWHSHPIDRIGRLRSLLYLSRGCQVILLLYISVTNHWASSFWQGFYPVAVFQSAYSIA